MVARTLSVDVLSVERFPTGLCHYVYDVALADGRQVVARLAAREAQPLLAGGVYWHARLRDMGVPLPALLAADTAPATGYPYMLLERLPGQDLGLVYDALSTREKGALAVAVTGVQRAVGRLPRASGYGYALSYEDAALHATWRDVVVANIERSSARFAADTSGQDDARWTERTLEAMRHIAPYLHAVPPAPFLDDLTTKNVLLHRGALAGIVDTDMVCFGDPLYTLALTRAALLAGGHDTRYTDLWRAQLDPTPEQMAALDCYTAVFCLDLLSETGQRFNREQPIPANAARRIRLEAALAGLLTAPLAG